MAAGAAGGGRPALASPVGPSRIVSLNPCLDAILVRVADRDQVAALSHYSHDPSTTSSGAAGLTYPYTHGTAEEVLALRPDLVVMARYTAPATRAALGRLGVGVEQFGLPNTVEESLAQVRRMGEVVGRRDRAAALANDIRSAVVAAAPPPGARRLSALVFQAGGFVAAQGTLMDDMLRRTGFANAASRYGLVRSGNVPLERLIADPPDVLLAGQAEPGAPTWADRVLDHPALARVAGRMHRAVFPQQLTYCGGPVLISTAGMMAQARRAALEARA